MDPLKRPSFVEAWLSDLQDDYRRYGLRGLFPKWAVCFLLLGAIAGYFVPRDFGNSREVPIALFAGTLTLNGLMLAVSWGAFAKIFEAVAAPSFVSYLRSKGLLSRYFFIVDYIHYTQVLAVATSGLALLATCYGKGVEMHFVNQLSVGAVLATTGYAIRYGIGAVRTMQDVVWYRMQFEAAVVAGWKPIQAVDDQR
jgi:hypothetical protein